MDLWAVLVDKNTLSETGSSQVDAMNTLLRLRAD